MVGLLAAAVQQVRASEGKCSRGREAAAGAKRLAAAVQHKQQGAASRTEKN